MTPASPEGSALASFTLTARVDEAGYVEFLFKHSGAAASDAQIRLGILDDGIARSGDGQDLGAASRNVKAVIIENDSVDRSSVDADYVVGIQPGREFAVFLTWRSAPESNRLSATGAVVRLNTAGEMALSDPFEAENAIGYLLEVELLGATDIDLLPAIPDPDEAFFTELSVAGFRGFAQARTLRFAQPDGRSGSGLTVLVGANNSGKSTFLEALHSIARGRDQTELNFPQPRRHRDLDKVTLHLKRSDGRELKVESISRGGSQAAPKWLPEGAAPTKFDIHLTPSRRNFSPYFGNTFSSDRNWGLVNSELSRTELREQFVGRLRKVDREPAARVRFDKLLEEIVGYELRWTIDEIATNQQFLKLTESDGAWHTSEGLGDGLVSMLFIVDALYDSEPGALIAIDEPELSLHPQMVRRLRDVISRFAADRQIVVATHSPLFIDWGDIANGASVARVYKFEGRSEISQASDETLRSVANFTERRTPANPHIVGSVAREAFFLEDGVIITEGQDDVTYLARVLADLGLPKTESMYGWGAGGASNIPLLAQLFSELGFSKIGAILDDDKQPTTRAVLAKLESMSPTVLVRMIPAPDIRFKKSVSARAEVVGLLDRDNVHVREELRESAKHVLSEILEHVAREATQSTPLPGPADDAETAI